MLNGLEVAPQFLTPRTLSSPDVPRVGSLDSCSQCPVFSPCPGRRRGGCADLAWCLWPRCLAFPTDPPRFRAIPDMAGSRHGDLSIFKYILGFISPSGKTENEFITWFYNLTSFCGSGDGTQEPAHARQRLSYP